MKKHHKERLLRLADLLDTVRPRMFDLGSWCEGDVRNPECGTTACAVGWAASDPWFQKKGLTMPYDEPWFNGRAGWVATRAFFGLEKDEDTHLFSYASYAAGTATRPRTVAKRIREFVA